MNRPLGIWIPTATTALTFGVLGFTIPQAIGVQGAQRWVITGVLWFLGLVASALGIGLHTVLRGYQQLRDEGLVELRRGRGAVITDAGDSLRTQLSQLAVGFIESVRRLGLDDEQTLELVRDALRST